MVENVRGHALRGAISRDLGLLIIYVWNGIACIFKAGESNPCAHTCVYHPRAYVPLFLSPRISSSFPPFLALSFIRIMNKYICCILTRVHGAWYARSVDQTRPNLDDLFSLYLLECIFTKRVMKNMRSVRLTLTLCHYIDIPDHWFAYLTD